MRDPLEITKITADNKLLKLSNDIRKLVIKQKKSDRYNNLITKNETKKLKLNVINVDKIIFL